ncbi:MAG: hypothetical protein ACRDO8_14285 [Nocardioidaceae bacterium]
MRTRVIIVAAAVVPVLAACTPANKQSDDTSEKCVGKKGDGLELAQGHSYDLANGADASLASTDMEARPPTATLELVHVSANERDAATAIAVGDSFDVKGTTYRVDMICQHVVEVSES